MYSFLFMYLNSLTRIVYFTSNFWIKLAIIRIHDEMKLGILVRKKKHTFFIISLQILILFAISNLCTSTFSFVISFIFGVKMEFCIGNSLIRCWFQFVFFLIRCLRSLLYPVNTVSIDCLWSSSSTKKKLRIWKFFKNLGIFWFL